MGMTLEEYEARAKAVLHIRRSGPGDDEITAADMLARDVLALVARVRELEARGPVPPAGYVEIVTNGTRRVIPSDEPVFLIRGQDVAGGDAVRAWAELAKKAGACPQMVYTAYLHADKLDAWPKKKIPDLKAREDDFCE